MGIITVYEFKSKKFEYKKKRTLCSREGQTSFYRELNFLPGNEQYLVAMTDDTNSSLTLWEWEKGKLRAASVV